MQSKTQSSSSETTLSDEWWIPNKAFAGQTAPRRILAEGHGYVLYSDGGRRSKECTKEQFERWRQRYACARARP